MSVQIEYRGVELLEDDDWELNIEARPKESEVASGAAEVEHLDTEQGVDTEGRMGGDGGDN